MNSFRNLLTINNPSLANIKLDQVGILQTQLTLQSQVMMKRWIFYHHLLTTIFKEKNLYVLTKLLFQQRKIFGGA
ncbi:MAG: hypothetical protein HQK51_17580 [Oligoflexia bacterium]|nr:hypothetical protein [Oligoflexia bacterium]